MISKITKYIRKYRRIVKFIESSFLGKTRTEKIINLIKGHIKKNFKILDIGSGLCMVSKLLIDKGYNVIPLDISDQSLYKNIKPVIYKGNTFPFKDKAFDVALILTVLHHTDRQKEILNEARRVANKLIIVEDIYENNLQKIITYIFDSIVNLEFLGHPHSNRTHEQWINYFHNMDFKITFSKIKRFNWMFLLGVYCIE
ncbi:MAG: class I SAM-dependent methyltransferase [Patescibacteria group bacterium]